VACPRACAACGAADRLFDYLEEYDLRHIPLHTDHDALPDYAEIRKTNAPVRALAIAATTPAVPPPTTITSLRP